jgi:hypothetical protein
MATRINVRFVFDNFFFEEVLKNDYELQRKLTYITSKASGNKKKQNTISNKSRNIILLNNPNISLEVLRYFLNKIDLPSQIENVDDEIERTIKMAINLTYEWPYQSIIFTSTNKIEEYKNNVHYQGIKKVSFINGEDAKALIDSWYKLCREEVQHSCD